MTSFIDLPHEIIGMILAECRHPRYVTRVARTCKLMWQCVFTDITCITMIYQYFKKTRCMNQLRLDVRYRICDFSDGDLYSKITIMDISKHICYTIKYVPFETGIRITCAFSDRDMLGAQQITSSIEEHFDGQNHRTICTHYMCTFKTKHKVGSAKLAP